MTKVKVFVYGRQRRQGYDNSSSDFCYGKLKSETLDIHVHDIYFIPWQKTQFWKFTL